MTTVAKFVRQGGPEKWASLGELKGLAGGRAFTMVDGGTYDPDKAYKDSKLCNMLFMAEAARRWGSGGITASASWPGTGHRRLHEVSRGYPRD